MAVNGQIIFHSRDEFGRIQVIDDGEKRHLSFGDNDQQSCQLRLAPFELQYDYTRAMLLPLLFCQQPQRALILGLGAGSLAGCLHHNFQRLHITAVELRQTVIDVAREYFRLPCSKRMEVVHSDAGEFLRHYHGSRFDLVFSDIFDAEGIADSQLQHSYLEDCRRLLSDDGWLVLNFWKDHRSQGDLQGWLEDEFSQGYSILTQSGNWVLMASNSPVIPSGKQLKDRAKLLSQQLGFALPQSGRLQAL